MRGGGFTAPVLAKLRKRKEVADVRAADGRLTITLAGEGPAAPLVKLLVASGAEVEEVVRPHASLEESFLAILDEPAKGAAEATA